MGCLKALFLKRSDLLKDYTEKKVGKFTVRGALASEKADLAPKGTDAGL